MASLLKHAEFQGESGRIGRVLRFAMVGNSGRKTKIRARQFEVVDTI